MHRYRSILLSFLILILVKLIFMFPDFSSLENKAQDRFFRRRGVRSISEEVVIIGIDDASFSALNISWPFPREYHAKLIENLRLAGARLVVFDIEFTENSRPEADALLADTAAYSDNVIFAGKVLKGSGMGMSDQLVTPIREINEYSIPWGIVNMGGDTDNVIRKYTLYELHDGVPYYSIGVAALANMDSFKVGWSSNIIRDKASLLIGERKIPTISQNRALINYYGPDATFPTVSYASVLDDETVDMPGYMGIELNEYYDLLDSGIFQDKIVLVGATVDELHDKFPTPFGGEWTSGVEIHANFIEMALSGHYLSQINPWIFFILEIFILLLVWAIFSRMKPQYSAIILVIFVVLQYALAYQIFVRMELLLPVVETSLLLVLIYLASLVCHYMDTMKEKRFIRQAFQQYMAPELVNELLKHPDSLSYGGSMQEITVLFSDIRSFTTYSENHNPEETVNTLKEYLTEMVRIIIDNQGILDKFVGDEIMALFGTPLPLPNHALSACRAALKMRDKMTALQNAWAEAGLEGFEIGIGINTGNAVVGNLGSEQIFDYTAIGDMINLGARLESINKEYDTAKHIIISEYTLAQVKDQVEVRYLDEVKVKGKNKAVKIYELISLKEVVQN